MKQLLKGNPQGGVHFPSLDVGCGSGRMLLDLQKFKPTIGLDISPEALSLALERGCKLLVRGDAQNLPVRPGSTRLITALDLLEHLDDDLKALAEMWQALAPGGRVFLTVPAHRFLWSGHDEALEHRRRYSMAELRRKVERVGFEIERLTYAIFSLFLPTLLFRFIQRVARRGKRPRTALILFPRMINAMFTATLYIEAHWLKRLKLPIGVSLICVARKP